MREARKTDSCILYGRETPEPADRPVDLRAYYIPGAGQLCYECYNLLLLEMTASVKRIAANAVIRDILME